MPAARGLKRTASKAETKPVAGSSKIKKKPEAKAPVVSHELKVPSRKGQVFTTGQGDVGQLGLGEDHLEKSRFTHVTDLPNNIVDICAGGMHTVAIDKEGNVWTFGCNDEGALGRDTEAAGSEWAPRKVPLPGRAVSVSAGDSHSAALLHTAQVFAWGSFRDSHGNMGLTLKGNERTPVEMLPGHRVVQIASGGDHLVMLTDMGQVFTCGCGEQGQLGRVTARSCDRHSRLGLNGLLVPAPLVFCRDKADFEAIWAGTHCTFARKAHRGDIYVWGLNNYQQIGVRKGAPQTVFTPVISEAFSSLSEAQWTQIAGGPHHSLALDSQGQCYSLGRREYGRLGLGEGCEDAKDLTPVPALKDKKCISISCGSAASFAVTDNGEVHVWGMGSSGQLGTGGEEDEAEPKLLSKGKLEGRHCLRVSAGGQHTVLLVALQDEADDEVAEPEAAATAPHVKAEESKKEDKDKETAMETDADSQESKPEKEEPKKEEKEKKEPPARKGAKRGRKASSSSVETKPSTSNKQNGGSPAPEDIKEEDEELAKKVPEATVQAEEEPPALENQVSSANPVASEPEQTPPEPAQPIPTPPPSQQPAEEEGAEPAPAAAAEVAEAESAPEEKEPEAAVTAEKRRASEEPEQPASKKARAAEPELANGSAGRELTGDAEVMEGVVEASS